ncbi:MAG: hypothetical protein F6K07_30900 [Okeania sp. SIO1H5]|uniref:hypothetical protein n=1 Tax=Okeania sp. SIO1F9 TaxID=2607813 RepID=UPI0013BBCA5C|nr:hypothetical protein [Okeania sp. SIO1F9]NET23436.1 hypothetical protein [Okeania sp. SIO1H5]NET79495.1 hypothetical protein [Okeania sp. SIO1F9]NET96814.1 hypothetical protein [Okeania sp. SIO1H2]
MYSKGKEEGRRKKEEERGKREEGYPRKKKPSFPVDIHPWVYTNDINGHDMKKYSGAEFRGRRQEVFTANICLNVIIL